MPKTETTDDADDAQIFEVQIQQITTETVTVRADSRSEAFESFEEPQDRDVQTALVRKDFSSLMERRPVDARHAAELEDYDNPDIDIDLTE